MKKLIALIIAGSLPALVSAAETAADQLQQRLNAIHSMSADFKQVVKSKKRTLSQSSGKMALLRPGKFRWDTQKPMAQLVIADGQKMWVYDVDLEQVTVKKQKKSLGGTAALFLSSYDDNVTRDYQVTRDQQKGRDRFDLKAKNHSEGFQRVKLIFRAELLQQMFLYDQLGQETVVDLTSVKLNPKLPAKLFQFTPPAGVDVVKQ